MNELLRRYGFTVFAPDDGGGNGGGEGGGDGSGDDGGEGGDGDEPKFTQAQANRFEKTGKAKGRDAALREVAESLGMSVDEAKEFIEQRKADEDGKKTDLERRETTLAAKEKATADREALAARKLRDADVMLALVSEGVTFDRDDDGNLIGKGARVLKLATSDLGDTADAAEITAAIEGLKADMPEAFTASSSDGGGDGGDNGGRKPPSGTPGGPKPKAPPTEGDLGRGAELAARYSDRNKPFDPLAKV